MSTRTRISYSHTSERYKCHQAELQVQKFENAANSFHSIFYKLASPKEERLGKVYSYSKADHPCPLEKRSNEDMQTQTGCISFSIGSHNYISFSYLQYSQNPCPNQVNLNIYFISSVIVKCLCCEETDKDIELKLLCCLGFFFFLSVFLSGSQVLVTNLLLSLYNQTPSQICEVYSFEENGGKGVRYHTLRFLSRTLVKNKTEKTFYTFHRFEGGGLQKKRTLESTSIFYLD